MSKTHTLPELPYDYDALEPHISRETLAYHHGRHHATYVAKLNGLIEGTEFADAPLDEIVRAASGKVFDNAAQVWNHSFYWRCLTPNGGGTPRGEAAQAIERDFGSFEDFRQKFKSAAAGLFGSGWAWLVLDDAGTLQIVTTRNADTPLRDGMKPLLTCDVWEHAYYIDYRNRRADYLDAFFALVNWAFVEQLFRDATQPYMGRAANA